jgi:DNA polymerase-3 subunit epsilon
VGAVQVYDGFEDPGRPIPAVITALTGITDAQVQGQRLDDAAIARFLEGVDVVIAHNAGFDRPFVEARLPAFSAVAWACSWADLDWKSRGHSSAKLEHLAAALGWFYDAHRADTDCHALLTVLTQPTPEHTTPLRTLLDAATQAHHRLHATGAPFEAKDVLKARGYRWDGGQRVWLHTLRSEEALAAELLWLSDAVYHGQPARLRVETLDARHRHSLRPGVVSTHLIGAGTLL